MALRNVSITAQAITARSVKFTWVTRVTVMRKAVPVAIASKESKQFGIADEKVKLHLWCSEVVSLIQ